jgi:hypothetical protein
MLTLLLVMVVMCSRRGDGWLGISPWLISTDILRVCGRFVRLVLGRVRTRDVVCMLRDIRIGKEDYLFFVL